LGSFFCHDFIESTGVGDDEVVDLTSLRQSDGIFDGLKSKCTIPSLYFSNFDLSLTVVVIHSLPTARMRGACVLTQYLKL
jgi:hypothetical protein